MCEWSVDESGSGLFKCNYPSILLEGLTKYTRKLSQKTRCPYRDLIPGLPEYDAELLPIQL
jgi:hypothetical protein